MTTIRLHKFIAVLMDSSSKTRGAQLLLGAIVSYLLKPSEAANFALDQSQNKDKVIVLCSPTAPLLAFISRLKEGKFWDVLKRCSFINKIEPAMARYRG
jgi:elongation factor G